MDDGAAEGKQLRINTQSFTFAENVAIVKLIKEKFGITLTLNSDKGKPRLRCSASSMDRLVSLVRAHILPAMQYKLSVTETQEPVVFQRALVNKSGDDLLSIGPCGPPIIGAGGLNCRVRDGNGWDPAAMDARNLIPYRDGEPELEPIAAGKLYREELPV